jgi:branched-chain amino acid transport system permease protein
VATLAAQFFLDWVFARVKWLTNNSPSASPPTVDLFGWTVDTPVRKYLFLLAVLIVFTLIAKNLVRGHLGRAWMATRDQDVAAEVIGIRPVYAKLTAFGISSFFCGVAGALWGFVHLGSWEPLAFDLNLSLSLLFMIIIGGMGSLLGAYFGAAFIIMLPILLNRVPELLGLSLSTATVSHMEIMIFGILIVLFLVLEPQGLARLWSIGKQKLRLWPFPH